MLQFSTLLNEVYDLAGSASAREFPAALLNTLSRIIDFDGAMLGVGAIDQARQKGVYISRAHVDRRDPSLVDDYQTVAEDDPLAEAFIAGLVTPLAVSCDEYYAAKKAARQRRFMLSYDVLQLMMHGEHQGDPGVARWVAFYRGNNHAFDGSDCTTLHSLWPHVSRALTVNMNKALQDEPADLKKQGLALIGRGGYFEMTDPYFAALCRIEWPSDSGVRLAPHVLSALMEHGSYKGRCLKMSLRIQFGAAICMAQPTTIVDRLSPAEKNIAHLMVAGEDYKTIAQRMATSPNTVRNQVASIYRKLGIHDKLRLAKIIKE